MIHFNLSGGRAVRRWGFALGVPALLWAGTAGGAEDWANHVRLGAQVGLRLKADFRMGGQFDVSSYQPGATGVAGVDHFYDDGYVRVDETGNAQGYTSYWGYDNASQYDASTRTLTAHATKSFSLAGGSRTLEEPQFGVELAYGRSLGRVLGARLAWELGLGLMPVGIQDARTLTATFARTVHSFDTGDIVMPTAPYNGGPSGVGPTIRDVATALPDDSTQGSVTGSRSLELNLYSLRFGPNLQWELGPRWAVSAGAGFAVGIVSGDYVFDETLVLADGSSTRNAGAFGATKAVFGGYASANLIFHLQKHAALYVGAQFMRLEDVFFGAGNRQARLNLSEGIYLSAGLNWPF
jgi:hypothetical protein